MDFTVCFISDILYLKRRKRESIIIYNIIIYNISNKIIKYFQIELSEFWYVEIYNSVKEKLKKMSLSKLKRATKKIQI